MKRASRLMIVILAGLFIESGCQSAANRSVLAAPVGANAAVQTAPSFAEAHYNRGMALYTLNAFKEGDDHFIQAANLAPSNKVIWDAPPLRGVTVPDKEVTAPASDGHMHSH